MIVHTPCCRTRFFSLLISIGLLFASIPGTLSAAITLDFVDVPGDVAQGDLMSFDIIANTDGETIIGFDVGVTIELSGFGTFARVEVMKPADNYIFASGGSFGFLQDVEFNDDRNSATASFGDFLAVTTAMAAGGDTAHKLATIEVQTSGRATGQIEIAFDVDFTELVDENFTPFAVDHGASPSVQVTGIPEPTAGIALGLISVASLARRRRG